MVEGLKLFLPPGASALTRERMAHLSGGAAKWQLYELDTREVVLTEVDVSDRGNVRTRLVHWTDEAAVRVRFAEAIKRVQEMMPEAVMAVLSAGEVAFRCHGLEFARVRMHSKACRRLFSELEARSGCWWSRAKLRSGKWCAVSEKYVMPKGHVTIRYGGCIRNAGWSLWWCVM